MPAWKPVQVYGTGAGGEGGALTAISAEKSARPNQSSDGDSGCQLLLGSPRKHREIYHMTCPALLLLQHSVNFFHPSGCPLWRIAGIRGQFAQQQFRAAKRSPSDIRARFAPVRVTSVRSAPHSECSSLLSGARVELWRPESPRHLREVCSCFRK
jgi:hypothetical protein